MCNDLKVWVLKLKDHLSNEGEFSICKSDGKPMGLPDAIRIGMVLENIDKALQQAIEPTNTECRCEYLPGKPSFTNKRNCPIHK